MNIFAKLGVIFGKVIGVVKVAIGIGKQLLPFVRAAREIVPQVDDFLDDVEAKITVGGTEADDFLDRNLGTLEDIRDFYRRLAVFAATGEAWTDYAIYISQTQSPDIVEPIEAQTLALRLNAHRGAAVELATGTDELEAKLVAIK